MVNETERTRILAACGAASTALAEIQRVLVPSAISRSRFAVAFRELLRRRGKLAERLPEGWVEGGLEQLVAAETLQDRARILGFLKANASGLSPAAVGLLDRLAEEPAFYAAFTVRGRLEEELFSVTLAADGREAVLLSPAVEAMHGDGALSYACLLASNGACLQAIGIVHYYRGLTGPDFHFFARMLRPQEYAAGGLAAVMKSQPEQFLMLDFLSEIPPLASEGEPMVSRSSMVHVPEFDPARYAQSFDIEEKAGVTRLRLKGCAPPFSMADLYHDGAKGLLAVYAQKKGDYARMALAVADQAELPAEPEWTASKNVETAVYMLLGKEMPAMAYEKLFAGPPPKPAEKAVQDRVNAFLEDVVNRLNTGTGYSVADLAALHDVDPETAAEVDANIRKSFDKYHIDVDGALAGIPAVSPEEVRRLGERLKGNPLFSFRDTEETRDLYIDVAPRVEALLAEATGKKRPTSLTDLPRALEELDHAFWRQERGIVLKYTLFLLCRKGGEFEDARDYAAEVLRKFWQVLIKEKSRLQIRRFVKLYCLYCRETLGRAGLVEIREQDPRSDTEFRMKASPFLASWLSPSGYWRE